MFTLNSHSICSCKHRRSASCSHRKHWRWLVVRGSNWQNRKENPTKRQTKTTKSTTTNSTKANWTIIYRNIIPDAIPGKGRQSTTITQAYPWVVCDCKRWCVSLLVIIFDLKLRLFTDIALQFCPDFSQVQTSSSITWFWNSIYFILLNPFHLTILWNWRLKG